MSSGTALPNSKNGSRINNYIFARAVGGVPFLEKVTMMTNPLIHAGVFDGRDLAPRWGEGRFFPSSGGVAGARPPGYSL